MRLIPSGNSHPTRGQCNTDPIPRDTGWKPRTWPRRIGSHSAKNSLCSRTKVSRGIGSFDVVSGLVADRSASRRRCQYHRQKVAEHHLQHCDHFHAGRGHSFVETGLRRVGLIHVLVGSLLRSGRCSSRGDPCSGWLAWQLSQASLGMRLSSLWWCSVVLGREAINHSFAK